MLVTPWPDEMKLNKKCRLNSRTDPNAALQRSVVMPRQLQIVTIFVVI